MEISIGIIAILRVFTEYLELRRWWIMVWCLLVAWLVGMLTYLVTFNFWLLIHDSLQHSYGEVAEEFYFFCRFQRMFYKHVKYDSWWPLSACADWGHVPSHQSLCSSCCSWFWRLFCFSFYNFVNDDIFINLCFFFHYGQDCWPSNLIIRITKGHNWRFN